MTTVLSCSVATQKEMRPNPHRALYSTMKTSYLPTSISGHQGVGRSSKSVASESPSTCSSIGKTRRMLKRLVSRGSSKSDRLSYPDDASTAASTQAPELSTAEYKKVRFAPTVRKRCVPSLPYISSKEWHATWYSDEERRSMKRTAKQSALKTATDYPIYVAAIEKTKKNAFCISASMTKTETHRLLRDSSKLLRHGRALREWSYQQEVESLRGLESVVTAEADKVVFGTKHRRNGRFELASEYAEATKIAAIHARLLGEIDASAARRIYKA